MFLHSLRLFLACFASVFGVGLALYLLFILFTVTLGSILRGKS